MWRRSTASIPASVGGLPATHVSTMSSRRYLSGRRFRRASDDIATMSVDGAPGVVLVVHLTYFRTRDEFEGGEEICARLLFSVDGCAPRKLCSHHQCLWQGELMHGHSWAPTDEDDELPRNCLFDPKFWSAQSDPTMDANRQAFANRFGANDPLRTCDMKQTLDAFLHYAFLIYCSPPTVRHEPWMPIRLPPQ